MSVTAQSETNAFSASKRLAAHGLRHVVRTVD